jgi:hypothetical protein
MVGKFIVGKTFGRQDSLDQRLPWTYEILMEGSGLFQRGVPSMEWHSMEPAESGTGRKVNGKRC